MNDFKLGQNSLEVVQSIIEHHEAIINVNLISHIVSKNWRENNSTTEDKVKNFVSGFGHLKPLSWMTLPRKSFLDLSFTDLDVLGNHEVWSMNSQVLCAEGNGVIKHIPMMNFHPEGIGLPEIKEAIKIISKEKPGVILDSGRYFHYYGDFLLEEREWVQWMGEFLGPCILVSPRYIGHRLHHGYSTLRLTADEEFKPKIPTVIEIIK